jgi:hypothetical protein
VIALPTSPTLRITLAIALSVLIHMALLFTPMVELAPAEVPLPPLMARLEPLPKVTAAPAKPKKKTAHKAVIPEPIASKPAVPVTNTPPEPAEPEPASGVQPAPVVAEEENRIEEVQPAHPLPKKAQLTFVVYKGTNFVIGEARHRLEIASDQSYTIKVGVNTTGIASVFKKFDLTQTSTGTTTAQGLRPSKFSESKQTSSGTEARVAEFNWTEKTLSFSTGNSVVLSESSQDIVSFMYQLSQLQWGNNPLALNISNGKKLEHYEISVGEEEIIATPMGKLRTIPFRKIHGPNEEGLDIWLAVEYRLLPVKISQTNRDGSIAGEMVISEMRVADE